MRPARFALAHPAPASPAIARRRFVALIGGALVLSACENSPHALLEPNLRGAGEPTPLLPWSGPGGLNARDLGARGDGVTDDTSALNAAIASLGSEGGTLWLPAGVYLVDPTKGIRLTDNITLLLDNAATLRAIPVSAGNYSIVSAVGARNIAVIGGNIVGERGGHLGTTGEWGMGIRIMGCSNIRIEDVQVSDCWGDGIYVGANRIGNESQNVVISKCASRNNRRQGLSITGCLGATIEDSEFTDTKGSAPESGIDLEPNENLRVVDVVIRNCYIARNAGYGLLLCGAAVSRVRLEGSVSVENGLAGAALLRGANNSQLADNRFESNEQQGVLFESAFESEVRRNSFRNNGVGQPSGFPKVLLTGGSAHNTIANNRFGSLIHLLGAGPRDIVITPDCTDNAIE
jgi:hypothetical protein